MPMSYQQCPNSLAVTFIHLAAICFNIKIHNHSRVRKHNLPLNGWNCLQTIKQRIGENNQEKIKSKVQGGPFGLCKRAIKLKFKKFTDRICHKLNNLSQQCLLFKKLNFNFEIKAA